MKTFKTPIWNGKQNSLNYRINVVCQYYEEDYQSKQPIPATHLGELMRLIRKKNSFKFNDKHFLQTHGIAMGTKMAVAFAVMFMTHIETQLLAVSPQKPIFWKRFIDDIFSEWTLPEKEISNFVDFANSFRTTIKFTHEMSSEKIVFLDTEVFKGPRFAHRKTLDVQTHYKPTETFQYTHFSSSHPFGCANPLQVYRNVTIYVLLFKSPSQC